MYRWCNVEISIALALNEFHMYQYQSQEANQRRSSIVQERYKLFKWLLVPNI